MCFFFAFFVFEIRRSPVDMVNNKYPIILQGFKKTASGAGFLNHHTVFH